MKAEEFLKLATEGKEAGEVIKDNYLTEAIVKLLNNYADIIVKNCSIPDVSVLVCETCDWVDLPNKTAICKKCGTTSPF